MTIVNSNDISNDNIINDDDVTIINVCNGNVWCMCMWKY